MWGRSGTDAQLGHFGQRTPASPVDRPTRRMLQFVALRHAQVILSHLAAGFRMLDPEMDCIDGDQANGGKIAIGEEDDFGEGCVVRCDDRLATIREVRGLRGAAPTGGLAAQIKHFPAQDSSFVEGFIVPKLEGDIHAALLDQVAPLVIKAFQFVTQTRRWHALAIGLREMELNALGGRGDAHGRGGASGQIKGVAILHELSNRQRGPADRAQQAQPARQHAQRGPNAGEHFLPTRVLRAHIDQITTTAA